MRKSVILLALALAACGEGPTEPDPEPAGWQTVGEWDGTGNFRTPDFDVAPHWRVIYTVTGCPAGDVSCPWNLHVGRAHPSGVVAWFDEAGGHFGAGDGTIMVSDGGGTRTVSLSAEGVRWSVTVQDSAR